MILTEFVRRIVQPATGRILYFLILFQNGKHGTGFNGRGVPCGDRSGGVRQLQEKEGQRGGKVRRL